MVLTFLEKKGRTIKISGKEGKRSREQSNSLCGKLMNKEIPKRQGKEDQGQVQELGGGFAKLLVRFRSRHKVCRLPISKKQTPYLAKSHVQVSMALFS